MKVLAYTLDRLVLSVRYFVAVWCLIRSVLSFCSCVALGGSSSTSRTRPPAARRSSRSMTTRSCVSSMTKGSPRKSAVMLLARNLRVMSSRSWVGVTSKASQ
uniref:Rps6-2 n=1 Tax=Arundo donax TaxID=35708 RepID=A0A0A9BR75_ARUDO